MQPGGGFEELGGWTFDPFTDGTGGQNPKVNIQDLRRKLWEALLKDPDCLSFLGSRGIGVLGLLDKIPIDFKNVGADSITAVTESELDPRSIVPKDPIIHINTNGFFEVKGLQTAVNGINIKTGTPLFQAVTLFHELGHATNVLADDSKSTSQSHKNTEKIVEKCKNALSNFSNK